MSKYAKVDENEYEDGMRIYYFIYNNKNKEISKLLDENKFAHKKINSKIFLKMFQKIRCLLPLLQRQFDPVH